MSNKFYINVLTIFGIGKIKYAPGTFASLFTCFFYFYLFSQKVNFFAILIFYFFIVISSINLINSLSKHFRKKDSKEIVIDEFIGQSIPILFLYAIFNNIYDRDLFYFLTIITFVLFRFFDILKPFPINLVDKKMKNGLGVILDDILAGLFSIISLLLIIWLIIEFTAGTLGVQIFR